MNRLNAKRKRKKKNPHQAPEDRKSYTKGGRGKNEKNGHNIYREEKKRSSCKCRDSDLPKAKKEKERVKKGVGHVNRCRVVGHSWEETSKYIQVVNDSLFQPEGGKCLNGKDKLCAFADAKGPRPLSNFEAELLHAFSAFSGDGPPLSLLLGSFAAVLAPELFFSLLALLFKTLDNIDRSSGVSITSA